MKWILTQFALLAVFAVRWTHSCQQGTEAVVPSDLGLGSGSGRGWPTMGMLGATATAAASAVFHVTQLLDARVLLFTRDARMATAAFVPTT